MGCVLGVSLENSLRDLVNLLAVIPPLDVVESFSVGLA
jgi:hypothetical protein